MKSKRVEKIVALTELKDNNCSNLVVSMVKKLNKDELVELIDILEEKGNEEE